MFGGDATSTVMPGETWAWDGTNWSQRMPATSPPARNTRAMAYDSDRQRIVMFGGYAPLQPFPAGDTWEWDGTNWTQRMPGASPPDDREEVMVYDPVRHRMILIGDTGMWFWLP